jgi:hypothetical protein
MNKFTFLSVVCVSILTCGEAQATFGSSAALSCSPNASFHAGYTFQVASDSGTAVLKGELFQNTFTGANSLGSEEMVIRNIGSSKTCNIQIKQRNDQHGNGFRLVIQDAANSIDAKATLDLKLGGKSIDNAFRGMTCFIDQGLKNRVCSTSFGGAIYQSQSGEAAPAVRTAQ